MALDFGGRTALVVENGNPLGRRIVDRLGIQGAEVTASVAELGGRTPDVLVIALETGGERTVAEFDPADIAAAQAEGLAPAIETVAAVLPGMRAAGRGRIVVCIPSVGVFGADRGIAQAIAAGGLLALARSLAVANVATGIATNMLSYVAATAASEWLFEAHPMLRPQLFPVDVLVPAVTWLAHDSCPLTGEVISAAAGRFAKLFTSVTLGGFNPALADDAFAELLPKIADTRATIAPRTIVDELITVVV